MQISLAPDDLRPLIRAVIEEVLERQRAEDAMVGNRLAYREAEAAALLGLPRHTLRDARLRGEITGSRVGKRVVYSRDQLMTFLRR